MQASIRQDLGVGFRSKYEDKDIDLEATDSALAIEMMRPPSA